MKSTNNYNVNIRPQQSSVTYEQFLERNWKQYLKLEQQLLEIKEYVEFDSKHYNFYSDRLRQLFFDVCSEIDNVGKVIAIHTDKSIVKYKPSGEPKIIGFKTWLETINNNSFVPTNIKWYHCKNPSLKQNMTTLEKASCELLYNNSIFSPWQNPQDTWWKDYNELKHKRDDIVIKVTNDKNANLGNVLNAFAGLYLLNISFLVRLGTEKELSGVRYISRLFDDTSGLRTPHISVDEINEILCIDN